MQYRICIVELHKFGKIWAESEGEGFGCTFFVQLPLHSHNYVAAAGDNITPPIVEIMPDTSAARRTLAAYLNKSLSMEQPDEKQSEVSKGHRPVTPPPPAQPPVAVVEATWKPTILVVDDSAMNRKMLVHMLISKGFACVEAEDGVEGLSEMSRMYLRKLRSGTGTGTGVSRNPSQLLPAIELLGTALPRFSLSRIGSPWECLEKEPQERHQFAIDAVLIDSNMPRMNGPEVIVEMRKVGFCGPIIGVSGGDEKIMKEFLKAGADNVMQKPAQSDKLVNMLLTGLQLVVKEATSRKLGQLFMDGHVVRASEKARYVHISCLQKFIEEAEENTAMKKKNVV